MADGTKATGSRGGEKARRLLAELLEELGSLQEFGSLGLTAKHQLTLPEKAREAAGIESMVYVWGSPELRMLMLVGQPPNAAEHLKFLVSAE